MAAYLIDGFAYASEALVGQSVGAKNRERFKRAIRLTTLWALVVGAICSAIIWFAGPWFIDLMTVNAEVRETARHYLFWAALTPLLGTICFQFDGIFTGAMATRDMRNMMVLSLMIYLAVMVDSRTQFRQSRPVGGAQCFLYRPRRDLCYADASTCACCFSELIN